MLVDPKSGELTRVGIRRDEDGRQVRYAIKSGDDLD
jgi:ribosomal protein L24